METLQTDLAWSRAVRDPQLRDLPYKIETNEHGQLVLSPHKLDHSFRQSRLYDLLGDHVERRGHRTVEFAIATPKGVKVADVVWLSAESRKNLPRHAEASPFAPDICIEVVSASNTESEMTEKRRLYFEQGADEVWVCYGNGQVRFFSTTGEIPASKLAPGFPSSIE